MAMTPTWHNVYAPSVASGGHLYSQGMKATMGSMDALNKAITGRADLNSANWDNQKNLNTQKALNQIAATTSMEDYSKLNLDEMLKPYGAQVDTKSVREAYNMQDNAIKKDFAESAAYQELMRKASDTPIYNQAMAALGRGDMKTAKDLAGKLQSQELATSMSGKLLAQSNADRTFGLQAQTAANQNRLAMAQEERLKSEHDIKLDNLIRERDSINRTKNAEVLADKLVNEFPAWQMANPSLSMKEYKANVLPGLQGKEFDIVKAALDSGRAEAPFVQSQALTTQLTAQNAALDQEGKVLQKVADNQIADIKLKSGWNETLDKSLQAGDTGGTLKVANDAGMDKDQYVAATEGFRNKTGYYPTPEAMKAIIERSKSEDTDNWLYTSDAEWKAVGEALGTIAAEAPQTKERIANTQSDLTQQLTELAAKRTVASNAAREASILAAKDRLNPSAQGGVGSLLRLVKLSQQ